MRRSIYEPWRAHYIDYEKLKQLLREHDNASDEDGSSLRTTSTGQDDQWTDDDESAFVEELVNVQLEKVYSFQVKKYQELRDRTSQCESKLEEMVQHEEQEEEGGEGGERDEDGEDPPRRPSIASQLSHPDRQRRLSGVLEELDDITKEINRLEQFSRINFTGFLKAAKKHDRKRGLKYRIRPLLEVRLRALPFNSEDYSPLLFRFVVICGVVWMVLDISLLICGEQVIEHVFVCQTEPGRSSR